MRNVPTPEEATAIVAENVAQQYDLDMAFLRARFRNSLRRANDREAFFLFRLPPGGGPDPTPKALADFRQELESLGYDTVVCADRETNVYGEFKVRW